MYQNTIHFYYFPTKRIQRVLIWHFKKPT